ncbi:MAG: hypothetical protein D6808_06225 [Candidatus Dadabacteria bacterium]|nr:MAG: hypothetical protein D6808_06225 [Candidatus Dadabacteria bacterium]
MDTPDIGAAIIDLENLSMVGACPLPHPDNMKNILVVSHERSGTHFLINSIAKNFSVYSNLELSFGGDPRDLSSLILSICNRRDRRIFKSHHQAYFFEEVMDKLLENFHVFYIVRDGRDVVRSCYDYFNAVGLDIFPQTSSLKELVWIDPTKYAFDGGYSKKKGSNMFERWALHAESWLPYRDVITIIRYEELKRKFNLQIKRIGSAIGMEPPQAPSMPTVKDRGIVNRKGLSGGWKGSLSDAEIELFLRVARNIAPDLGYHL